MGCLCSTEDDSTEYKTAACIPESYFRANRTLKGVVVNVADGDTIRCRHVPQANLGDRHYKGLVGEFSRKLKSETILVRIYAVDAPETAKGGGRPGQPLAEEATSSVKNKLLGEVVELKLLGKDQYGRVLAAVQYREGGRLFCLLPRKRKGDISKDLLDEGLATIYSGRGAVYDGKKDEFERSQDAARRKKKGIWKAKSIEMPGDYKARMKQQQQNGPQRQSISA